jgi:Na+/melibiose symporter-like transporter
MSITAVLSLLVYSRYGLNRERHREILQALEATHARELD